jgi:hypothetical protein
MATITLTDCKILLGGYNLSGYHNQLGVEYSAEMLDDTVFGTSGTRSSKPGLKKVAANGTIFWDDVIDEAVYNRIGAVREVMSWAAVGNSLGDIGYTTRGVNATYNPLSGEVGQLLSAEFNSEASNTPLVRGLIAIPMAPLLTATGDGGVLNLGLLGAGKRLYSGLHVVSMTAGSSIAVIIQSDDSSGMGSPTTRITHDTINEAAWVLPAGRVGNWKELAGPIATDTHWRAQYTITGTTPSISAYLTLGIL